MFFARFPEEGIFDYQAYGSIIQVLIVWYPLKPIFQIVKPLFNAVEFTIEYLFDDSEFVFHRGSHCFDLDVGTSSDLLIS